MDELKLSALMCSRLCHDLVSPIGAIVNGLEILEDENDAGMIEQVHQLLNRSAAQASSRLQFYRMSFGSGGGFDDAIDMGEVRSVVAGLVGPMPVEVTWNTDKERLPKPVVKILLNLILIASEALIRGGTLEIEANSDAAGEAKYSLAVVASGDRIFFPEGWQNALAETESDADFEPKFVPGLLASLLARKSGSKIEAKYDGGTRLDLTVKL